MKVSINKIMNHEKMYKALKLMKKFNGFSILIKEKD